MFRIRITGGAPGISDLVNTYDDRALAERVAQALLGYLDRNTLPDHRQGVRILDEEGQWIWRQSVGSGPERRN